MKNTLSILLSTIWIVAGAQQPEFDWAKRPGGTYCTDMTLDNVGNIYSISSFQWDEAFYPDSLNTPLTNAGGSDIMITKSDPDGNPLWFKQIGGPGEEDFGHCATDANGNLYVTGSFEDTVDFDPGSGVQELIEKGKDDVFILKLDGAGNFLWVKQLWGKSQASLISITNGYQAMDASGNLYITGYFMDTVDFDPGPGIAQLVSEGGSDGYVCKFDPSGNLVWAKSFGGIGDETPVRLTSDDAGNTIIIGDFTGTVDFDPGSATQYLTAQGTRDVFILKLDSSGNFSWVKQIGGPSATAFGYDIDLSTAGNVFLAGQYFGLVDFDPGSGSLYLTDSTGAGLFICKFDPNGDIVWARQFELTSQASANLAVDATENVYTTGYFKFTGDFDPGPSIYELTSLGFSDIYLSKLDANGDFVWAFRYGKELKDYGVSVKVDGANRVISAGYFRDTIDFDPGPGTTNLISQNYSVYLLALTQPSVGIEQNEFGNVFTAYPNPTDGQLLIDLGKIYEQLQITVSNELGQVVQEEKVSKAKILHLTIDRRPGIYFIQISSSERKHALLKVVRN